MRLLCCGWDACFWSSALEGSTIKQFHPVVCCMWRQYLTAAWLICLCPSSKELGNYALGPRLLDFMKCCRQFEHIFLVWDQLQRDRFHNLPLNRHQDDVPGVWCLRVWCLRGYGWLKKVLPYDMGKMSDSCTALLRVSLLWSRAYRARVCRPAQYLQVSALRWRIDWSWPHFCSDFGVSLCLCSLLVLGDVSLLHYCFSLLQLPKVLGYL